VRRRWRDLELVSTSLFGRHPGGDAAKARNGRMEQGSLAEQAAAWRRHEQGSGKGRPASPPPKGPCQHQHRLLESVQRVFARFGAAPMGLAAGLSHSRGRRRVLANRSCSGTSGEAASAWLLGLHAQESGCEARR